MEQVETPSRSLKFRVWNNPEKRMMDWLEVRGTMVAMKANGQVHDISLLVLACLDNYGHAIAQQFTGLKDKNGKDIYEGDIFTFKRLAERPQPHFIENNTVVEFRDGQFGFVLNGFNDMFVDLYGDVRFDAVEIIGNIFENPELCPKIPKKSKKNERK